MTRTSIDRAYRDFSIRRETSLKELQTIQRSETNTIRRNFRTLKFKFPKEILDSKFKVLYEQGLRFGINDKEEVFMQVPLYLKKDPDCDDTSKTVLQSTLIGSQPPGTSKVFHPDLSAISSEPSIIEQFHEQRRQSLQKLAQGRDEYINMINSLFEDIRKTLPEELLYRKMSDLEKHHIEFFI